MTEQTIHDLVVSLNGVSSVYDFNLHLPIPTLDFIKNTIGQDMTEFSGTLTKAKSDVKTFTILANRVLRGSKSINTSNDLEYLIATDKEFRHEFIVYVAMFISDIVSNGLLDRLGDLPHDTIDLKNNMFVSTYSTIQGGLLRLEMFDRVKYKYRLGY